MNVEKLAKMANDIGAYFDADPDRVAAMEGVAGHLKKFWDPRMRRELFAWVDQGGGEGLLPLVREVLRERRAQLLPE